MPKCDFNKIALLCNFIEITLRHGCSPLHLLHIFRTPFSKNTSGRLLLNDVCRFSDMHQCTFNLRNFFVSSPFRLEILNNMCIVVICCPFCFEINHSFLIKLFFYITKKSEQKCKYLKNFQHEMKSLQHEMKSIFHQF